MAKRNKTLGYAAIVAASVAYACGGGGGGGGGEGCPLYPNLKQKAVHCNDALGTILQWNEQFCAATPAAVCSTYFYGDLKHDYEFPDAAFQDVTAEEASSFPVPACVCDYGNVMSTVCSEDQNQNTPPTTTAGTNDSSEEPEPTGGEEPEPTGGEEPEPTGGEEPEVYICVKADEKCAKINYVLDPLLDDWKECWADPPPCVEALDQDDAIKQCEKKCTDRQGEITAEVAMYNADVDNADDETVKSPLDCDYDDDPPADRPRLAVDTDVCTPPADNEALPVWGGETPIFAYNGTASLTDVSGGSAGVANLWGYLAYETFACDKRSCTIRFDAIEGLAHDVSGTYTDGARNMYEYTLQDLDLRLVQAVEGIYYPARGTIVFPDVPFAFTLSTTGVKTDLGSFGDLETVAVATGASGSLTKKGELTLNLSYSGTHGSGTLTLQTR